MDWKFNKTYKLLRIHECCLPTFYGFAVQMSASSTWNSQTSTQTAGNCLQTSAGTTLSEKESRGEKVNATNSWRTEDNAGSRGNKSLRYTPRFFSAIGAEQTIAKPLQTVFSTRLILTGQVATIITRGKQMSATVSPMWLETNESLWTYRFVWDGFWKFLGLTHTPKSEQMDIVEGFLVKPTRFQH